MTEPLSESPEWAAISERAYALELRSAAAEAGDQPEVLRRILSELNARYDEVEADGAPHAQGMATAYDIAEQIVRTAFSRNT